MAIGVIISLGLAKVAAVVTLSRIARQKKPTQVPEGKQNEQNSKVVKKPR